MITFLIEKQNINIRYIFNNKKCKISKNSLIKHEI